MSVIKYKILDYIESTGTQYIDTGLLQQGFHILVDVEFSSLNSIQIISGTYGYIQSGTGQDSYRYYLRANTNGSIVTQFGGSSGNNLITGATLALNTRYKIEAKLFNGIQELLVNDVLRGQKSISGRNFPNKNIFLFANHDVTANTASNFCSCKIYSAKYYDNNGILIRDYVPILDNNDVPCMYDKVNDEFYYNAGTGDFIAGTIQETVYTDLIYDRTQEDVDYALNNSASTDFLKGAYNYTDLNRIEEWCEYLSQELKKYSYSANYTPRENPDNVLINGSLRTSADGWNINSYNTLTQNEGYVTIKINKSDTGTRPNYQLFDRITGPDADTKQIIYVTAKIRGRSANTSYPRVYVSSNVGFNDLGAIDGKTGTQLNDEEWHTLSKQYTTYDGTDSYEWYRVAFGINESVLDDAMDVKEILIINLTEIFGRGNEPSKTWCDENLVNYSKWWMWQFPTISEFNRIKNNLTELKEAYYSYTALPDSMNPMNYQKANSIEKILSEMNNFLENMKASFLYSGTFYSGESEGLIV